MCVYLNYLISNKSTPTLSHKRRWKHYSKELLQTKLATVTFKTDIVDVQNFWNFMEQKLVQLADLVAPMEEFVDVVGL